MTTEVATTRFDTKDEISTPTSSPSTTTGSDPNLLYDNWLDRVDGDEWDRIESEYYRMNSSPIKPSQVANPNVTTTPVLTPAPSTPGRRTASSAVGSNRVSPVSSTASSPRTSSRPVPAPVTSPLHVAASSRMTDPISKPRLTRPEWLYALECEGGKYYIGKTNDPDRRWSEHSDSSFLEGASLPGAAWTRLHRPIRMLHCRLVQNEFDEENETLRYMNKFGIDNVRGAGYVMLKLPHSTRQHITRSLRTAGISGSRPTEREMVCYRCGEAGHFVATCSRPPSSKVRLPSIDDTTSSATSTNDPSVSCLLILIWILIVALVIWIQSPILSADRRR